MANASLHAARGAKYDEFYTRLEDINEEMNHYEDKFRGKVILCNCDDPKWSNFWKYFHLHFEYLGLKKLIATHYEYADVSSYKIEYGGGDDENFDNGAVSPLNGNGDFRSPECLALLDEADIVVTNPPFSLFREYIQILVKRKKEFLIIGNINAITYKEVFPLLKNNKVWLGISAPKEFFQPDGTMKKFGNIKWFTTLDHVKRHDWIDTPYEYSKKDKLYPELYPKYDNYDAINVSKIKEIPKDYDGVMGVPITFLDRCNPKQFEILGITLGNTVDYPMTVLYKNAIQHNKNGTTQNGGKVNTRAALRQSSAPTDKVYYTADNADGYLIAVYPRILIRRKSETNKPKGRKKL